MSFAINFISDVVLEAKKDKKPKVEEEKDEKEDDTSDETSIDSDTEKNKNDDSISALERILKKVYEMTICVSQRLR